MGKQQQAQSTARAEQRLRGVPLRAPHSLPGITL